MRAISFGATLASKTMRTRVKGENENAILENADINAAATAP